MEILQFEDQSEVKIRGSDFQQRTMGMYEHYVFGQLAFEMAALK